MKVRINKSTSIMVMPVLALALLFVLGVALAAGRDPVTISGEATLGEVPPFFGEATINIGNDALSGDVTVIPLQPPYEKDGVTHYPEVMHLFNFGDDNTLTTIGAEFAVPTDENPAVLTLHGNMDITDGTGVFKDASGELRVNGQMDFSIGQVTFESKGTISR
ncbi:MAG: hypothetical protein GWN61_21315 [candidate division Zixibacteria bacterium]|nr:hypothetical protein [Phycisphaerae bacterium]NIR66951.1 hypothetical protein [candidate division Zixibacteria bacterium]NIW48916.1 hypothetical protein [Gammaproteobacteria bacterium]NIS52568.1 hypothetical protein [Phycisphaerae bacterium]NIV08645.1 hypothetical protein [candidate division Zixibacteria bacterium]